MSLSGLCRRRVYAVWGYVVWVNIVWVYVVQDTVGVYPLYFSSVPQKALVFSLALHSRVEWYGTAFDNGHCAANQIYITMSQIPKIREFGRLQCISSKVFTLKKSQGPEIKFPNNFLILQRTINKKKIQKYIFYAHKMGKFVLDLVKGRHFFISLHFQLLKNSKWTFPPGPA